MTKINDMAIRLELNLPRFYICEVLTPFSANIHHIVTCEYIHLDIYNGYPYDLGKNLEELVHRDQLNNITEELISARCQA